MMLIIEIGMCGGGRRVQENNRRKRSQHEKIREERRIPKNKLSTINNISAERCAGGCSLEVLCPVVKLV